MDGASLGKEILYVLTPMAVPGIASTLLLNVILAWNEAFWTLQLSTSKAAPLTAFIASYSSPEGLFYATLSAASTMAIAPILKNIAFPLQMAGMAPAEQDRRVEDAARILAPANIFVAGFIGSPRMYSSPAPRRRNTAPIPSASAPSIWRSRPRAAGRAGCIWPSIWAQTPSSR